jgi:hypothetical protein
LSAAALGAARGHARPVVTVTHRRRLHIVTVIDMADEANSGPWQRRLTLAAVIGMAYWFFGNLYEAVVFSPNWVEDSPAQFARLHGFFSNSSPTLYFVPITQLATVLVWVLWWRNRDDELTPNYRRAGVSALLLTALTAYIVAVLIPRMFGEDYLARSDSLTAAAWQWNVLNVFRMALTAVTAWSLFSAFRKLDRRPAA